jgi:hypothetical protein
MCAHDPDKYPEDTCQNVTPMVWCGTVSTIWFLNHFCIWMSFLSFLIEQIHWTFLDGDPKKQVKSWRSVAKATKYWFLGRDGWWSRSLNLLVVSIPTIRVAFTTGKQMETHVLWSVLHLELLSHSLDAYHQIAIHLVEMKIHRILTCIELTFHDSLWKVCKSFISLLSLCHCNQNCKKQTNKQKPCISWR